MNWGVELVIALVLLALALVIFYIWTVIRGFALLEKINYKTEKTTYFIILSLLILNCTIIGNVVVGVPFFVLIYFVWVSPYSDRLKNRSYTKIKNN
jgi:asparagine N-glycosylation enzyme membrane subunit Stt3